MNAATRRVRLGPREVASAIIAAALLATLWLATRLASTAPDPSLVMWVATGDVMLGVPALAYLLLVRRGRLHPLTVAVAASAAFAGARWLTAGVEHRGMVTVGTTLWPFVAAGAALLGLATAWRVFADARRLPSPYWSDRLASAVGRHLGDSPVVNLVVVEVSLLVFCVAGWRLRFRHPPRSTAFTSWHANNHGTILLALATAAVVEAVAVHLWISHVWSPTAASFATFISVYSLVWLVGDFNAVRLHPHLVDAQHVRLRVGFRGRADIRRDTIARVVAEQGPAKPTSDGEAVLAPLGQPNVALELTRPVEVLGLFGRRRTATLVRVAVDDPEGFVDAVRPPDDAGG